MSFISVVMSLDSVINIRNSHMDAVVGAGEGMVEIITVGLVQFSSCANSFIAVEQSTLHM